MQIEQSPIEGRAAVHAALGDPARLRIVDALHLGDASPSELAALLGMPSNLLAHHLKTLARAGVVSRRRSEGDGRRIYLHLVAPTSDLVSPPPRATPERVMFVCTANSARSHLAAALWRGASTVPAESAGTHPADRVAPGARTVARRHHLDLPDVTPQAWTTVASERDLVVTVCDRAHEELGDRAQLHWSVPDPVHAGSRRAFEAAYDDLASRVTALTRRLTPST